MLSEALKKIVVLFKKQGKMNFLDGTTEDKISAFEKEMKVTLPSKYRAWLRYSDGGELFMPAGVQLYGIEHTPLIDVNDNSRPNDDYIVIGAFASGDSILCKKDEETISIYNLELGEIDKELVYPDFIAFLNDLYMLLGIGD